MMVSRVVVEVLGHGVARCWMAPNHYLLQRSFIIMKALQDTARMFYSSAAPVSYHRAIVAMLMLAIIGHIQK